MSLETLAAETNAAPKGRFGPDGIDRRRRHRARVTLPVHIRGGIGSIHVFEDICKTIDASRDGLLVATEREGYWKGQLLEVRLGCGAEPTPVDTAQRARVIRNTLMPNHLSHALALEFQKVEGIDAAGQLFSAIVPMTVGVLLVESDLRIAALTRDLLQEDGYEVVHAANGKEAFEILLTLTPDVLLAGAEGGEINGQELCAIMKSSIRLQHIPVILMTRSAQPSDYSACHQVGAVICMAQPYAPNKLQHAVWLLAPPPGLRSAYSGKTNISSFIRTR
jgi:CheY-like chemotaxis protein